MLHLAAPEQDGDLDLVVVLEELAGLGDLGVHVVVARLGADADLLQLLLADLAGLVALLRVREAHLAVVEDLADRRPLVGGHLHQVQAGLPRLLQGLRGRHDAQLLPLGADQADRADADLLVHARATVGRRLTVEMSNTESP